MVVHVLVAGMKGAVFLKGLVDAQVTVERVFAYAQADDHANAFDSIEQLCNLNGIELLEKKQVLPEDSAGADLIFVVGWQYLLTMDNRMVVFHDSLLPRHRGFAPSATALIAGDDIVGVTAFSPVGRPDAGPILAHAQIQVQQPARIGDVLRQQAELMAGLATQLVAARKNGPLLGTPQDETKATYSLWRDAEDYFIDWTWSSRRIERFVYAVGYPYDGAQTILDERPIVVRECTALTEDFSFAIRDCGKVWEIRDGSPVIVCGTGLVRISGLEDKNGNPVVVDKLRTRFRNLKDWKRLL